MDYQSSCKLKTDERMKIKLIRSINKNIYHSRQNHLIISLSSCQRIWQCQTQRLPWTLKGRGGSSFRLPIYTLAIVTVCAGTEITSMKISSSGAGGFIREVLNGLTSTCSGTLSNPRGPGTPFFAHQAFLYSETSKLNLPTTWKFTTCMCIG